MLGLTRILGGTTAGDGTGEELFYAFQKVNSALYKLDAFVNLYFLSMALTAPPASPADGDAYLVASGATGAWAGQDNKIAAYLDSTWRFWSPLKGCCAYNAADGKRYFYTGSAWQAGLGPSTLAGYGITDAAKFGDIADSIFTKADYNSVVFTKTAASTISIKAGTRVGLGGAIYTFATATAVTMPTLTAGTDYAIYICSDGTLQASSNFSYPSGYSASTSRKIGGFHYAPGGNATAQAGGDSTPAINAYSLWDLKWRPACPDPRGMEYGFGEWVDIYMLNNNPQTNGTSAYGVTIADGSSPPVIPAGCVGADGSTRYTSFTWWNANEVLRAYGKTLPSYATMCAHAGGVTEGTSVGSDPVSTGLDAARTSNRGLMQVTGNMWIWLDDPGTRIDGADIATAEAWSWHDVTGGRGQIYSQGAYGVTRAIFGGSWSNGSNCGSRSSVWADSPWFSFSFIGARGRCDHLRLV